MISLLSTRLSAFLPAQGWMEQAVTAGGPTVYGIFNVGHGALRYNHQDFYSRLFRTRNALPAGAAVGRVMSSLAGSGGLAGAGGIAGIGGGLAG